MIQQTVLPFKIEITRDTITSYAGLALLGEFYAGLNFLRVIDRSLPKPWSGAGYMASEYVFPSLLMLNGGGRSLEDMKVILHDAGLREIFPLERILSSNAAGAWLRRMGEGRGLGGLDAVQRKIFKRAMKYDEAIGYTLYIYATGIEAQKESAEVTYKGFTGYDNGEERCA